MAINIKQKLGANAYKVDSASHITIDARICQTACTVRYCTFVCPAGVYTLDAQGSIHVEHDGCLECGTCIVACQSGALAWHYPRAGYGVQYRFG